MASMTETINSYLRTCNIRRVGSVFVSDATGYSHQQIYRALLKEGTSLKKLVDAERRRRVELALESGCKDIPTLVRISGCVQLRRKFHKWYNKCPKEVINGQATEVHTHAQG